MCCKIRLSWDNAQKLIFHIFILNSNSPVYYRMLGKSSHFCVTSSISVSFICPPDKRNMTCCIIMLKHRYFSVKNRCYGSVPVSSAFSTDRRRTLPQRRAGEAAVQNTGSVQWWTWRWSQGNWRKFICPIIWRSYEVWFVHLLCKLSNHRVDRHLHCRDQWRVITYVWITYAWITYVWILAWITYVWIMDYREYLF